MKNQARRKSGGRRSHSSGLVQLINRLASNCENPAHVLELLYWSREPELAEIMRNIVAMPDETRRTLHAFLRLAEGDLKSMAVEVNAEGDLTLSSSIVTDLLTMVDTAVTEKRAPSLN
jgi:hypothetical protein